MSLENLETTFEPTLEPTMLRSLKTLALQHKKRLFATFGLVAAENLLLLIYPLVGSFAVNAVLNGQLISALAYALIVLIIWGVGAARRAVDTRAFTRIYTELAVPVILNQRVKGIDTSTTTARVALSREFVNFFEHHLPTLITSAFSIIGAVVMLLLIEFWSGVVALAIVVCFGLILPRYVKVNDLLYFKLNNRLEKEVNCVERAKNCELMKHYGLVEKLRVLISNREALSFLAIGIAMAVLFGATLTLLTLKQGVTAGHIYAVITYLWTFAISLDDAPRLVEELSKLKDIGKRVEVA
ncbi:ABC transporter six-transmembrane domain-containing protein [Bisgaard Taxon 10/6]|uniref:ABC transporter six-transmembrane domain-containing protein n=1 Tax=Exercitatus varius TaxID=67857 RepID=A0ABT6EQL7_9PAST|nr:ABC transporter six-transmembrane domain-containing protein [Exercitatus varius]MDG2916801.1 ABC transporter six-transmembrane domain-containing protein [Exercitatus varius]MDG2938954.1 ABC transporter six-transmembrane domain-containing protein [Exercitatus varius]MDG2945848.1 ABC transporter six-transmembrane domain-containing protein [Exercitatus varius]MDG2951222.1 ABC transporter six-transmembrane domain-containing protein [Exercitatus varius]